MHEFRTELGTWMGGLWDSIASLGSELLQEETVAIFLLRTEGAKGRLLHLASKSREGHYTLDLEPAQVLADTIVTELTRGGASTGMCAVRK